MTNELWAALIGGLALLLTNLAGLIKVWTPAASTTTVVTTASYPTGLTADARLDIVHLGDTSYSYVVYDKDSNGATKSITAGQTGTVWWLASASAWTSF